ncbi:porin [Vibrio sp. SS-MA-C1-2]|uniref:porin n=1 Tax=Vibrio sp. SS-MA-C1-2 TaxID=2908646 RepID=UPI001F1AEF09|nr:porin [Vibrio sp. SS-MA-C1-2]UJF19691.1 porin [Vibrio sp. SS-MA-C1-2]
MKRTLLALLVAATASNAMAANIYQNDTTSVGLKGEIDATMSKSSIDGAEAGAKDDLDADVDMWAKIQMDINHKINDTFGLKGSFEIESDSGYSNPFSKYNLSNADLSEDKGNSMKADDVYVALSMGDNWVAAAGEIGDVGDSLDAITIDNTNEGLGFMDDYNAASVESRGHAIGVKGKVAGVTVVADTYFNQDTDVDQSYGISAEYDIAGFTVGATYQGGQKVADVDYYNTGVAVGYAIGNFSAKVNYVAFEGYGFANGESANADNAEGNQVGLSAAYQIQNARVYFSGGLASADAVDTEGNELSQGDTDLSFFTVGTDYQITNNLTAFVEYSQANYDYDIDQEDTTQQFGIMGVYFTF